MARVIGVDARGRPGFWTTTLVDGRIETIETIGSLEPVLDPPPEVDVVSLDIPLGHEDPRGLDTGKRACDVAARSLLGDARDRVFWMPPHAVLNAEHYPAALERCRENGWPKLEAPLWYARDRLQRIRQAAGTEPRLVEVHPETSFALVRDGQGRRGPMQHYGQTWAALEERLTALKNEGLHPEGVAENETDPRAILDATAAAWTAQRVSSERVRRLPDPPPRDPETGRPVAIHA